ncbi:MAG: hypothetical protein A2Z14_07780 [Chloroflexi bacterium RBG_16_48_8]|nr:MAG: hypothetical protein A2Z14_07780 [Chloroflexi bacterium RBG_16_48_8]
MFSRGRSFSIVHFLKISLNNESEGKGTQQTLIAFYGPYLHVIKGNCRSRANDDRMEINCLSSKENLK